jgi:hypothetical protein
MAMERASLGSFFCDLPDPRSRTLAAKVGGTSTTSSPTARSLLGKEVTEPAGRLDRPESLGVADRELEQPLDLQAVGPQR